MDAHPSSSKDTTAVAPKLNEEQTDNDKVPKKFVLPPEYDENDSRWTLKYREPAPGLCELIELSSVYVNADKLAECEKTSNDCKAFARMLLTEIFTTSALSICSWTSETTNASDIHGGQARPGLDKHAREILLMYVKQFGVSQNWNITDYQCCVNGMRQIMLEMRRDRLKENYFDEVMKKFSLTHFRQTMLEMIHGLQKEEEDVRDKLLGEDSQTRNWFPPREYNENDSRWTLKYREPAPGLVELMPQSGVFVNADKLTLCVLFSKDSITLARKLLDEIFTTSALQTCSWTCPKTEDSDHGSTNARPGLNENAMKSLLNFVAEFELENDLIIKTENKYTENILRQTEVLKPLKKREHISSSLAKLEEESDLNKSYARTDGSTSLSKYFVTKFPKLNEDLTEQNDKRKFVLPTEYDENDSRWTLKYCEPAPGLVELIEDSRVYVNADKLVECKTFSTDCHKLTQMLLFEIFTKNALSTCALPAALCESFIAIKKHDIPTLNLHATETLLKFIAEYGLEKDWKVVDYGCIIKEIHRNIVNMRSYGGKVKLILPPEYDANDSRWTLKYREPAPGLVELVEHSGIYVNADKLAECKTLSKDCVTLARRLVNEIFTTSALSACVITSDLESDNTNLRPRLDEHAMRILLEFVAEYGLAKDWKISDHQFIQNCIRQKMEVMRYVKWNKRKAGYARKSEHHLRWTMRDSIWTLVHRLPYEREVELLEHSGVYVDADKLTACKKLSNDCVTLALRLLTEVFKMSALRECSLSEKNRGIYETLPAPNTRPHQLESCELDAHAEIILLNFVDEYGVKMGWPLLDFRFIRGSMLKKIQEVQGEARVHFHFLRNITERWTIQYREPAPGLVELMEHSGVYVDADKLSRFKNTDNIEVIVPRLLDEVFTMYALGTCTLPAALYNDIGIDAEPDRPELDLHATTTLLEFVQECGEKQGRKRLGKRYVIALIHCRLEKERRRRYTQ